VADICEYGNEPSGYIKYQEFLDYSVIVRYPSNTTKSLPYLLNLQATCFGSLGAIIMPVTIT
jgi:hypothetical protein